MNIRDPRTQKILLGVIALGGLFYVYFGLSVLPFGYPAKAAEIKALKADYAKVSSEVTQARRLAADQPRPQYPSLHAAGRAAQSG